MDDEDIHNSINCVNNNQDIDIKKSENIQKTENIQKSENIDIKSSTIIQRAFRNHIIKNKIKDKQIKDFIKLLSNDKYQEILDKLYIEIIKVLKCFPPAKNENKMIYGKLIEYSIIKYINQIVPCEDLDKKHKFGSNYKYDCKIKNVNYSIKVMKQQSNVIVINKNSNKTHNIKGMCFIICEISSAKLYIFRIDSNLDKLLNYKLNKYIKNNDSNITITSALFTQLKKYPEKYIVFPKGKIYTENIDNINNMQEVNPFEYLYKNFIEK